MLTPALQESLALSRLISAKLEMHKAHPYFFPVIIWIIIRKKKVPSEQVFPVNPSLQAHLKPLNCFVHVPPFVHGLGSQKSIQLSQLVPFQPALHKQTYPPPINSLHCPLCLHVFVWQFLLSVYKWNEVVSNENKTHYGNTLKAHQWLNLSYIATSVSPSHIMTKSIYPWE